MELHELKYAPMIKSLVIKYMQLTYEEYASSITDQEIVNEYNMLKASNKLHLLAEAEIQNSDERMKDEFGD